MPTTLGDILAKPIDRAIDGVIKADDETSLGIELDEYVLTNEIGTQLSRFLDAYNNYETANGVWISGFFGSGKSHLLKMLAIVLENREVEGRAAWSFFEEKLERDPMIRGALDKAVRIPSRSILFNIDQKATVIAKDDVDALLGVFQQVFDESCGYFGKQPHVARFERDLDGRGQLADFAAAYERVAGRPWERGREQVMFEKANIAQAFAEVTGGDPADAKDILDRYRADTRISIEDFAADVKTWIDAQEPGFRLNFFVDEVGQYIADNVKLMTNLQTIAETLNTKCKGQAWLIVTAQQAIDEVVGDRTAQQENDFSKIQARFGCRMPLNSADVAEVIQRRLLAKTDAGQIELGNLYDREEGNLGTLFDFADDSVRLKSFRGREHFIASYPFPPYQYELFQKALQGLSTHNAFEGKHSSVGERSMLGVIQQVARMRVADPVGRFASFDLMFEGIRSVLKSQVQQSLITAEGHLDDAFALRVLYALFLVKYVNQFKATPRNIAILLMTDPSEDRAAARKAIETALLKLERETYIQRDGDVYAFLTDEEKDVEDEIKNIGIDQSELEKLLEGLIFDQILRRPTILHHATKHEYPYTRMLDHRMLGRKRELGIDIVTPLLGEDASVEASKNRTFESETMEVLLPDDGFVRDLTLFAKTGKFLTQSRPEAQQATRGRIIAEKQQQNRRRETSMRHRLETLLSEASIFVHAEKLDIGGTEAQERISKAFQNLVDRTYTNLPMLRGHTYTDADIARAVTLDSALFGPDGSGLTEAEQQVLNRLRIQHGQGLKVSAKDLLEWFGKRPFGWPAAAVLCFIAGLSARTRVEARLDSTPVEGSALVRALGNSNKLGNILLTLQEEFTATQIKESRTLYKDFFDSPAAGNDARSLGPEWAEAMKKRSEEIAGLLARTSEFPFVTALEPMAGQVATHAEKPPGWFLSDLPEQGDALLDAKEDVLDPIKSFINGPQGKIYTDARRFLNEHGANLEFVEGNEGAALREALDDPACFRGNAMQGIKDDLYDLKTKVEKAVLAEREGLDAAIADCAAQLKQSTEFEALDEGARAMLLVRFDDLRDAQTNLIPTLREKTRRVRTETLRALLIEADRMAQPALDPAPMPPLGVTGAGEGPAPDFTPGKPAEPDPYVDASALRVAWSQPYLATEADLEAWLDAVRTRYGDEIRAGRKVIV